MTPPAVDDYGKPDPPMIATLGFQPRAMMDVKTFLWALYNPGIIGNDLIAY